MSKRTKTRAGHANPTSERNRRRERHIRHEWGWISLPSKMRGPGQPARHRKRRTWLDRQAARKAKANDGTY